MIVKVLTNLLHKGVQHLAGAILDSEDHLAGADVHALIDRGVVKEHVPGADDKVEEKPTETASQQETPPTEENEDKDENKEKDEQLPPEDGVEDQEQKVETNEPEPGGSEDKDENKEEKSSEPQE